MHVVYMWLCVLTISSMYVCTYFGAISEPCCKNAPVVNQKELFNVNWFSSSSGSSIHGYGLSHSVGDNRPNMKKQNDTPIYTKPK